MIEFNTYIDGRFVNTQRADGLVVATPTGSTAYALSGGGPLLHPSLDAVVLVPICPHTLSHRPIVVGDDSLIEVVLCPENQAAAQVAFDGQANIDLRAEDRVRIRRKQRKLRLIHPEGYDYFHILRAKLRWGEQP
jgi:NAD+ kinase